MRRILLALFGLMAAACRGPEPAPIPAVFAQIPADDRLLVVFVPGVTGSVLKDAESGEILWGTGRQLLVPRDGGYALARSIHQPVGGAPAAGRVRVETPDILRVIRLGGGRKKIYQPLVDLFERAGFAEGDLSRPEAGGTFFPFPYDWRQDNVASAQRLQVALEGLRRTRQQDRLVVALVCQSNGASICRYFSRYGGASLAAAEAGRADHDPGLEIRGMVFIGTANGGSLRILREVDRGRTYLPLVGRTQHPEVLFTFPSLYQELPDYRSDFFLDDEGKPVKANLWQAANWEKWQWSVFAPEAAKRLARQERPDLFGNLEQRRAFLKDQLARARRFRTLLRQGPAAAPVPPIFMVQNAYRETPDRAVLRPLRKAPKGLRWRAHFTGDRWLRRQSYLRFRTSAPGDDHATRASQLWLSAAETAALAAEPFYVRGGHFEMILEPAAERRLLEFLAEIATP
ncbi:MAG: hypothetical protein AAF481_07495 [Acidobacteriota bacterium]